MTISRAMITLILALSMSSAVIESHAAGLQVRKTNVIPVAATQAAERHGVAVPKHLTRSAGVKSKLGIKRNPIAEIPLASLAATRERPIFSPSRRPPPAGTPAPTIPTKSQVVMRPSLTLLGAISAGSNGMAIFFDKKNGTVIQARVGEGVSGWTLRHVSGREATLESNRRTAILSIPSP